MASNHLTQAAGGHSPSDPDASRGCVLLAEHMANREATRSSGHLPRIDRASSVSAASASTTPCMTPQGASRQRGAVRARSKSQARRFMDPLRTEPVCVLTIKALRREEARPRTQSDKANTTGREKTCMIY